MAKLEKRWQMQLSIYIYIYIFLDRFGTSQTKTHDNGYHMIFFMEELTRLILLSTWYIYRERENNIGRQENMPPNYFLNSTLNGN